MESCINDLCSVQRAKIRNGSVLPIECRKCGVGVQTESKLCSKCGSNRIQHRLAYREK